MKAIAGVSLKFGIMLAALAIVGYLVIKRKKKVWFEWANINKNVNAMAWKQSK